MGKQITERDGTIFPESRMDARVASFFLFFLVCGSPTGGCQSGDRASQTKPSIQFPSCKAQCDIVALLFFLFLRKAWWLRGKGDPLTVVANGATLLTIRRGGWRIGTFYPLPTSRFPHPQLPTVPLSTKEYSLSRKSELSATVSLDCGVLQY